MRNRTKGRSALGKDRVREASRRLRAILKASQKLGIAPDDLAGLPSVAQLKAACRGGLEPSNWMFFSVLALGVIFCALVLLLACGAFPNALSCANSTNKEIHIQTIRLDRPSLESGQEQEESTLFNESEDMEDAHVWQPPPLRLRKER